jgi:hypothetical protein
MKTMDSLQRLAFFFVSNTVVSARLLFFFSFKNAMRLHSLHKQQTATERSLEQLRTNGA